jgi:DNA-binding MarR family transcriptional regulator
VCSTGWENAGYIHRHPDSQDRCRVHVITDESAQTRILKLYGPFYERLGTLFMDYSPDEIAVLADWFTRARSVFQESLDEIRQGVSRWPESDR